MSEQSDLNSLRAWTHLIYGLHAWSVLAGLLTPAFVVTMFVTGWPSLIAVVLNYVKRDEAKGTPLESHFRWQIRTFWIALPLLLLGILLWLTLLLIPVAFLLLGLTGLWIVYRLARGWIALAEGKPLPM